MLGVAWVLPVQGPPSDIPNETPKALGSVDIPRGAYRYNREYFIYYSLVDYSGLVKEITYTQPCRITGDGMTGEKFTQTHLVKANKT